MSPRRRKAGSSSAETPTAPSGARRLLVPTNPTICYGDPGLLVLLTLPGMECGCPLHAPNLWTEVPGPEGILCKVLKGSLAARRNQAINKTTEAVAPGATKGGGHVDG